MSKHQLRYTAEEKTKMDSILNVFRTYVKEHSCFDILFSEKCGYLYVEVGKDDVNVEIIENSSDLLFRLFTEVSSDVRSLQMNGPHIEIDLYPEEIEESRKRLSAYFESLEDELKKECLNEMEDYLSECGE